MSGKLTKQQDAADAPEESGSLLADLRTSGGGLATGPDLSSLSARPKRRINLQTMVVVLVLAASAGALYMMRRQGMGAGIRFDTKLVKIDPEIEKLRTPSSAAELRILADLARSTQPAQVAGDRLPKNPFVLDGTGPERAEGLDPDAAGRALDERARAERERRLSEIKTKLAAVQLHSVMDGPVPLARVNAQLVRVGDMVDDLFLVAQIQDRSIDLIVDGQTFTIHMAENQGPGRTPGRPGATHPRR